MNRLIPDVEADRWEGEGEGGRERGKKGREMGREERKD